MSPPVSSPLVLRKSAPERFKTLVKNGLAAAGVDLRGWRGVVAVASPPDAQRLADGEYVRMKRYAAETLRDYAALQRVKSAAEMRDTCEAAPLPLVERLLRERSRHRRVVDIGAAYVKAESALCAAIPDVTWDMLDLADNLAAENADVRTANMEFVACYPLEFLERTANRYDVALFNRVLAVLPNGEVRSYLAALSSRARFIVFSEPGSVLRFVGNVNVDAIPPARSLPMRGRLFIHNYRGLLAEHGFTMRHYDAYRTPVSWHGEQHYLIQGVAENTRDV